MSADEVERIESPWGIHGIEVLRALTNEALPLSEEVVRLGRNRFPNITDEQWEDQGFILRRFHSLATCIRTGGLFVFDKDDIPPMPEEHMAGLGHLPPMPFPRMWIEVEGYPLLFVDIDGSRNVVLGWGIVEVIQGSEWSVYMPMLEADGWLARLNDGSWDPSKIPAPSLAVREYSLKYGLVDGKVERGLALPEEDIALLEKLPLDEMNFKLQFLASPEYLVHLTHVLGVTHDSYPVPRARRREFTRRTGIEFPQLYFVNLRSAGDDPRPGNGDREYRHRWMVRGHYREHPLGEFVLPHKGACTWVRPYIKGPRGAPWKGRPVYRSKGEEK